MKNLPPTATARPLASWNTTDPCDGAWVGVSCDDEGSVTKSDLGLERTWSGFQGVHHLTPLGLVLYPPSIF